eukprot:TRINITY_DN1467_c0_g1_i4.p1 TRINITY_DN1467_c0_g1~~TRINITY_DN1467_c0_g1_i4.p1  ORF type:complete len:391 (+),score=85.10 TRINITY_DN1467_c0_g1_i4:68-1174(+)
MSTFIYVHRHPLRTNEEFFAKMVYLLVALAMVTVTIVTFTVWISGIDNTFQSYWSGSSYKVTTSVQAVLDNCNYSKKITIGGRDITAVITGTSSEYFFMTAADLQNTVFGVTLPTVILSVINKLLFRSNRWFVRWEGLLVRTNIILPTIEIFLHVWAIVAIVKSMEPASFADDYISYCVGLPRNGAAATAKQIDTCFAVSFTGLLIALSLNLFVMLLALIRLACDASNDDVAKWARVRYEDFHRNAKKGIPGVHGNEANNEIVPPKRAIMRALKAYPDIIISNDERRVDLSDGGLYTRGEFIKQYGGVREWDAAPVAQQLPPLHEEAYEVYSPAVVPQDDPAEAEQVTDAYFSPPRTAGGNPPPGSEV